MADSVRDPAVAGQFYAGSRNSLLKEAGSLIETGAEREGAIGAVLPHAGYVYSGAVAGSVLSIMKPRTTYIIIGPNHTGMGERFSMAGHRRWKTPLGDVEIDRELSEAILKKCGLIKRDALAHLREHSIEVQLPLLQLSNKGPFSIVPIAASGADIDTYRRIGTALAASVKEAGRSRDVAVIASSDMTHYEERDIAERKDKVAIEAILALDEEMLVRYVEGSDISMCGYIPVAIMLSAVKELGARAARLVRYQTSGDVSGDYTSVVGYAGILIK
ncbi:MAG: AmmeMemoRadiSam system protein B [Candidatus Omnitrophota bacterium]